MRKIILVLFIAIGFPSISFARLGETVQQNIARYGNPVKDYNDTVSPILRNADTKPYNFKGWKIRAGYLEGHAVRITYSKLSQGDRSLLLKEDEISAILNAESLEGKRKKLPPRSFFNSDKSGNILFDSALIRWINTNNSIAYILIGNSTLYVETPAATKWDQSLERQKEIKRKESIPKF
jgi:hypothetical protein